MNNTKMTIHRALAELKLIDSRISKAILDINPVGLMQKDKLVDGLTTKEDFEKDAKAKCQSAHDLIKRKTLIKSAIVKANSITIVTIGGKNFTISDAITMKSTIVIQQDFIDRIKHQSDSVKARFNIENEKVTSVALANAKIMIGKQDDGSVKPTDEDVRAIIDPFVKRNEYHLVDPLKAEKFVEDMQSELDDFTTEVDATLSEINAITIIEI